MKNESNRLDKLQLKTNVICYGPEPEMEEEVEQHLTVKADGRIWLSHYRYGSLNGKLPVRKEVFSVPQETAQKILQAFAESFRNPEKMIDFVTDVGRWELTLTDTEGKVSHFSGSAVGSEDSSVLSELTRRLLQREDLFVLDGHRER